MDRDFPVLMAGHSHAPGVGVALDEERVARWHVEDFRGLFAAVRRGHSTSTPLIDLRGRHYRDLYQRRTHRDTTWNLAEAAA